MSKESMKQIWVDCEIIGKHLNCTKNQVFQYLYQEIKERDLVSKAIEGDFIVLDAIKKLPGYKRLIEGNQRGVEYRLNNNNLVDDDNPKTPEQKVKIALWFINKMGSIDLAERALRAAKIALEEMNKNDEKSKNIHDNG